MLRLCSRFMGASLLIASMSTGAWGQDNPASKQASVAPNPAEAPPATAENLQEIVVTARRRSERAQTVPVSIAAFSASALAEHNVQQLQDLNLVIPGFRFGAEGGGSVNDVTLRGLSKIPLGTGIPAVVTYFAEVPLPPLGTNVPTYDLSNIQVLKGPQGTLFGRNTLGGAVLISPAAPSDQFEGYGDIQLGDYGFQSYEAAVNIPIVGDQLDLRVAGQIRRRDGYVRNLNGGPDFNDVDENSYRVSLLARPTDTIKNTTIFDYFVAPENANAGYLYKFHPGAIPGLSALLDPQLAAYAAGQRAAGPDAAYSDIGGGTTFRRASGVTNDTAVDINDDIRIRNLFGYRKIFNVNILDTGGNGPLTLFGAPFTLFTPHELDNREYFTDEIQILGKSLNRRLNWVFGAFYNYDDAAGPMGSTFTAFSPVPGAPVTALVNNNNYALYGQAGLDLSDWLLQGLTFNLGYRYSWDNVHACGGSLSGASAYLDSDACEAIAARNVADGVGDVGANGGDPSWTIGLDYKYSQDQFFYVTSRHGYRGVNVNTPLFETQYTTGGVGCPTPTGICPDLRPFQTTKPEKITDVEIGSKTDWRFGEMSGRFDIAAYWSEYKNAIQFFNTQALVPSTAPDSPTNGSLGINAADETIMGVELTSIVRPTSDLIVTLDGAYTDQEIDKVAPPSVSGLSLSKDLITLPSPKLSGTVSVNYVLPVQLLQAKLVFNGDYFQTARFSGQYGQKLPGYDLGNIRVDWVGIGGSALKLSFYIRNVADRHYIEFPINLLPVGFPTNTATPGEPRTFAFEARYSF